MRSERRSTAAAGRLAACSAKLKLVLDIIYNVDLKTRPVGSTVFSSLLMVLQSGNPLGGIWRQHSTSTRSDRHTADGNGQCETAPQHTRQARCVATGMAPLKGPQVAAASVGGG